MNYAVIKTGGKQHKVEEGEIIAIEKLNIEEGENSKDKSSKNTNDNEEIVLLEKNNEIDLSDEINNARKKRRRSSANIE